MEDIEKFKHIINYTFNNRDLLKEALTHRSYAVERKLSYDNQRLEFLGDAVLEIIITEYLFNRYPDMPEGTLTKTRSALVKRESLAKLGRKLKLGKFIYLGRGEQWSKGEQRDSTLADAFEALTGALFLDCGLEQTRTFILELVKKTFPDPAALLISLNPKGALQELSQKLWGTAPEYLINKVCGPDHSRLYHVSVKILDRTIASGSASKRKSAESIAAENALQILEENNNNIDGLNDNIPSGKEEQQL